MLSKVNRISGSRTYDYRREWKILIRVSSRRSCLRYPNIFLHESQPKFQANSTGMFVGPTKWLLFQDSRLAAEGSSDLRELLGSLSILPDSDVTIGRRLNGSFVELVSVYRPSPGRELIVEDRGFWEDGSGFHLGSPQAASARRKDLRGTMLKSCLVVSIGIPAGLLFHFPESFRGSYS